MRRPLIVLAAWLAVAVILIPRAARLEQLLEVSVRVSGSESAEVDSTLAILFGSPFANVVVLVAHDAPSPATEPGRRLLDTLTTSIRAVPGVAGVQGYAGPGDSLLLGVDGGWMLVVGLDATRESPDAVIPRLRAVTAGFAGATLRWTGPAALNADLRRVSAEDAQTAERRVLPLSLLLLLVAFGTLVAALLPVAAGVLTISLAFGAAAIIAARAPLSIMLQNVVTMIGLGLGIDYALLAVSRFREGLAAGLAPRDAARDTVRHAGHTIALSGCAVAVGFAGLLAVPVNELRSVGVGGLITVAVAVLVAVTLLPALLAALGPRINRLRIPLPRRAHGRGEGWRRWGLWVTRHPMPVLLLAGLPVVALAWPARRMVIGEPGGDWLPPQMESAAALHDLERMGRSGQLHTLRVLLTLPAGAGLATDQGWAAAARLQARLASDARVAYVRSPLTPDGATEIARELFVALPGPALRHVVSPDGQRVLFDVVPREGLDPNVLLAFARELRRAGAEVPTGLREARVLVGGLPAFRADYLDAVGGALPFVVLAIVAGTTLALAWGFRSVLVPLKAVALNLLSVAAGFGAVVLVFQDGRGAALFGLTAPVDQVFVAIPALVFCAVFGLSMDYEVFLLARVAEARRAGAGEHEAIADGLAHTGPVITNAAAIMVVVFGAFALGEFLLMRMLGLALAVTVLVDATLVRTAIGPALLSLAGRWNWWPGDRRAAAPRGEGV